MAEVSLRKAADGESLRDFRGSTVNASEGDHVLTENDGTEVLLSADAVKAIKSANVGDAPSHDAPTATAATPTGKK